MAKFLRVFGGIGAAALVAGIAVAVYAFTNSISFNSNTTPISLAYNSAAAPAFTASGIHFSLVSANTWNVVSFNLDNIISNDASLTVNDGTGTFIGRNSGAGAGTLGGCIVTSGTSWTCTATSAQSTNSVSGFSILVSQ